MVNTRNHFDSASIVVIALTLILFLTAILFKGLTHDMLLEAGVFLVSVKLILQTHKNSVATAKLEAKLEAMHATLRSLAARSSGDSFPREEARLNAALPTDSA